jgi:hypothetical protein
MTLYAAEDKFPARSFARFDPEHLVAIRGMCM